MSEGDLDLRLQEQEIWLLAIVALGELAKALGSDDDGKLAS